MSAPSTPLEPTTPNHDYGTTAELAKLPTHSTQNGGDQNGHHYTLPRQSSKTSIDIKALQQRQNSHPHDIHQHDAHQRESHNDNYFERDNHMSTPRSMIHSLVHSTTHSQMGDNDDHPHFISYHKAKDKTISLFKYIGLLNWLLLLMPVSIGLYGANVSPIAQFITAAIAIIPAAGWMGDATEQLSDSVGPGLGGLLNATFGNAAELIISLFAMYKGEDDLVKASLVGSILGNLLLVLGCAILAGGIKFQVQTFSRNAAGVDSNMAVVAAVAILVPAIFDSIGVVGQGHSGVEQKLSLGISVILFSCYISFLVFQLKTHRDYMENFGDFSPTAAQDKADADKTVAVERSVSEPSDVLQTPIQNKLAMDNKLYDGENNSGLQNAAIPVLLPAKSMPLKDGRGSNASPSSRGQGTPRREGASGQVTPTYAKVYARAGSLTSATNAAREYLRQSQSMQTLPARRRTGEPFSNSTRDILNVMPYDDGSVDDYKSNIDDVSLRMRRPLSRSGTADERLTRRNQLKKITQARADSAHSEPTNDGTFAHIDPIVPANTATTTVDEESSSQHGSHVDNDEEEEEEKWSRKKSIIVLTIATGVIAILSEVLTSSVQATGEALGLGQIFIGVIIVAIVGNAAEHSTAILMALADNMDVAISIAFGSALQIAMFVLPVIVFFSYARSTGPMDLLLAQFEVFAIAVAAIISWIVVQDGGSNYLEGIMLLVIYLILALGFFFGPSTTAYEYMDPLYCLTPGTGGATGVSATYSVCPGQTS